MSSFYRAGLFVLAGLTTAGGADLPIQNVVIYKNGVALFERSGTVPAGEQARLEFRTADMNDILKSLIIADSSGHRINSIRYDSNETLEQRLRDFPFSIGSDQLLSHFLDSLKGAPIEIKTADKTISGSILGARALQSTAGEKATQREQVSLLLASGELVTIDLGAAVSFRFEEPALQDQLKRYLRTVNQSRSQEKRSLYIDATGSGQQNLKVSYVVPTAIWKSSYRLTLDEPKPTIEGWAIVDNTTDEDWDKVHLSVVSGRPVSFISQLDVPRYGKRPVAELPDDTAAGPVVYGGNVGIEASEASPAKPNAASKMMMSPSPRTLAQGSKGFVRSDGAMADAAAEVSSVQNAESGALGELFQYGFTQPITIKRNQSALIPFVQDRITARKLLIFDDSGSEHPVNAAEITNSTGKTLDGGPLTVFAQGAYAGEALVETVKAGDKRLIGYAVDYGTRITTAFDSGTETILEAHGGQGILRLKHASRQTRTYSINNVDPKPKTLVIQQEGTAEYNVISPKPTERTASAYRFELPLQASNASTFKVQQERVYESTVAVTSVTPEYLVTLVQNKQLSENARRQLQALADLKRRLADTTSGLDSVRQQISGVTSDQQRLRQNIDSLNRVNGQEQQVRQYSSQLGNNEIQLAKLRDQQQNLEQLKTALEADVRNAIARLEF